jgi:hypothetical protein
MNTILYERSASHEADLIASFRGEVIQRATLHGQLHVDRAMARGIDAPEVEAVETGFMTALLDLGDATGKAERETASCAATDALDLWKFTLERLSEGPDSPYTDQCFEVDNGDLLSLLRSIDVLDHLSSDAVQATWSQADILAAVAWELLDCPATIKMGVRDNQDGNLVTGLSS